MIERHKAVTKKSLAGLTLQITLVLGLAMFSGPGPEFKSFAPTLTKTELAEIRSTYSKRTACFKKVSYKNSNSFQQAVNPISRFTSSLWQYDNTLRVKLRVNFIMVAIFRDPDKTFQSKQNLNDSRDESDRNKSRG